MDKGRRETDGRSLFMKGGVLNYGSCGLGQEVRKERNFDKLASNVDVQHKSGKRSDVVKGDSLPNWARCRTSKV